MEEDAEVALRDMTEWERERGAEVRPTVRHLLLLERIGPLCFFPRLLRFSIRSGQRGNMKATIQLLFIIVLVVSKMVQALNYPGMPPRHPRSVSFFSTSICCGPPKC